MSSDRGWVVGSGTILATGDGGRSWKRQYAGSALLYQVDFVDATHGWAVGICRLLATDDGGQRWFSLPSLYGSHGPIRAVHFVSATVGYAVAGWGEIAGAPGVQGTSQPSRLLVTGDGGRAWHLVPGAPSGVESVCFTTPLQGWLGTLGRIWRTVDGGRRWTLSLAEPPPAAGGPHEYGEPEIGCSGRRAASVLFLDFGVAMSHEPYLAYATEDGTHWNPVMEEAYIEKAMRPEVHAPDGPGSYPGPFSMIDDGTTAFVTWSPPITGSAAFLDLATAGGTRLVSKGPVTGVWEPSGAAFVSPDRGWVTGLYLFAPRCTQVSCTTPRTTFRIEATTNGGATWVRQYQTTITG